MQKVIRPQMRPEGFKAIERHREAGHAFSGHYRDFRLYFPPHFP